MASGAEAEIVRTPVVELQRIVAGRVVSSLGDVGDDGLDRGADLGVGRRRGAFGDPGLEVAGQHVSSTEAFRRLTVPPANRSTLPKFDYACKVVGDDGGHEAGDFRLTGKIAVVTGATGGLGEAICLALAAEGALVIAVARRPARL